MATLLGTLPSCCKSEMERHGDGPKPELTALAEPEKSGMHRAPASALCRPSGHWKGCGQPLSSPEVSAAASSLRKTEVLIRAVELKSGRSSHGPWFRLPAEPSPDPAPAATPRHRAPPTAPGRRRGLGYPPGFSKQDAEGGQWLQMDLQLEPLRASAHLLRLTQFCVIAQFDFLTEATGDLHGYTARAGAGFSAPGFSAPGARSHRT